MHNLIKKCIYNIKNLLCMKNNKIMPLRDKEEIIKKDISNYIKNIKFNLRINSVNGYLEIFFIKGKIILPILENNSWNEIKRNIDRKLKIIKQKRGEKNSMKQNNTFECIICYKHILEYNKNIICLKCTAVWCLDCYTKIINNDMGIVKCPLCRYDYGCTFDPIIVYPNCILRFCIKIDGDINTDIFSILYYN